MNFAYQRFLVQLADHAPTSEVFRPIVPILVHGPKATILIRALLDCGADFTLFPLAVATATGIEIDRGQQGSVGGIEGGELTTFPGDVVLELSDPVVRYRWQTTVRFAESNNMLLGHLGCLEYFVATLDHQSRSFTLEPNAAFQGEIIRRA